MRVRTIAAVRRRESAAALAGRARAGRVPVRGALRSTMRAMNALTKLLMTAGAACACLLLLVGPVAAEEEPADDATAEEPATDEVVDEPVDEAEEEEGGRIPIAETPRDRIGLILLGALLLAGGAAVVNANRQLKGERPQATGEFRWR